MEYKSFETDRLLLLPSSLSDAGFMLELMNTPKWLQFIGDRNIHSIQDAENYIQTKIISQFERLGFGNYTLIRKEDGVRVGSCGLYDREGLEGVDIGFALLPAYENRGYGREAASRIMELALTEFGITEILAITTRDNLASQKLLEKLGLRHLENIRLPGDEEELLLYKIQLQLS